MAEAPLITIITVNLNNLEGLKKTMKSVFEQSWQEFEYIIIDGGSSDGSREFVEAKKDKIDYWMSEPDKGIYNGMNKGIKAANGEYLLFLNSGDWLISAEALKKAWPYIKDEDLIYYNVKVIDGDKEYIKPTPNMLDYDFFKKDSLPHQGTFIKSSCFSEIGTYDENYRIISDWKFTTVGILKFNFSYKKVDLVLAVFVKDGLSSKERNLLFNERNQILEREFKEFQEIEHLEQFKKNVLASKSIKFLRGIGFLSWMNEDG